MVDVTDEDLVARVVELSARFNAPLYMGGFRFDFHTGRLAFVIGASFFETDENDKSALLASHRAIRETTQRWEETFTAFHSVIYDGVSAQDAFNAAMGID